MPIFRYFLVVGGALLGLLMLANRYFPNAPSEPPAGDFDRPVIRIHTSQQWPAPVPIDTNVAISQAAPAAPIEQSPQAAPVSKPVRDASADVPPPEPKPSGKPQRHPTHLARLAKRKTHQRIVAWQPLWQPDRQWTW